MADLYERGGGDIRNARRLVAFVGVYIILVSQFLVFSKPVEETLTPPYTGLALIGIGIVALGQLMPARPFLRRLSDSTALGDRAFWILAGASFSALAMMAMYFFTTYARVNYIPVVTVWLLGMGCYIYAFKPGQDFFDLSGFLDAVRKRRVEIVLVALLMVGAAAARFHRLGEIPRVLDGDEGAVGLMAQATVEGRLSNPFAMWDNFGALYLQLINVSMNLFGVTPFALRLLPAVGGTLAIPCVYLLAREIGGRRIGMLAAFLIAFSHSHIHFSRIASVAYIQGTWLAPLELYFLLSGIRKRQSWRAALGGVILAAHFSVYLTSQVIAGMLLVFTLLLLFLYRSWFKLRLAQAAAFWGGFFIALFPAGLYFIMQPGEFTNRLDKEGMFQSGWLQATMESTGQGAAEILFGRVVHSFLSLIYYPAFDFYGSPAPVLSMISTVMFLAGLGLAFWRARNPSYLLLNGYFWAATIAVGMFALPPSADSYRMLMALPAAMIMAAIGLDEILQMFGVSWNANRFAYGAGVSIVLLSLLAFNLQTYYLDFAGRCRFAADVAGRFASYLGTQIQETHTDQKIYLLSDAIFIYGTHPSTPFLSHSRPAVNFPDPLENLTVISGEVIIAPPSRMEELELWARDHPGGDLRYTYDCKDPILLMYTVP